MKIAVIVIDMQNAVVDAGLYASEQTIQTIQDVIQCAHHSQVEVIYIRHIKIGDSDFDIASSGSEIIEVLAPLSNEKVILKQFNSAFKETELETYLQSQAIETLVLTGAMTEYCFDTTVRVAFEKGYQVYIPEHGHTTSDSLLSGEMKYQFFTDIFNECFATVCTVESIVELLKSAN